MCYVLFVRSFVRVNYLALEMRDNYSPIFMSRILVFSGGGSELFVMAVTFVRRRKEG